LTIFGGPEGAVVVTAACTGWRRSKYDHANAAAAAAISPKNVRRPIVLGISFWC